MVNKGAGCSVINDVFPIMKLGEELPISREIADRIGQFKAQRIDDPIDMKKTTGKTMQPDIGMTSYPQRSAVQQLIKFTGVARLMGINRCAQNNQITDMLILKQCGVDQRKGTAQTPTMQ